MNYNVSSLPTFNRQAKRLAKKYPSLKKDLSELIQKLAEQPHQGKSIGKQFYKVRWSVASKGKGKSGGMRVITYVKVVEQTVYLVSVYDKSEQATVDEKNLEQAIRSLR